MSMSLAATANAILGRTGRVAMRSVAFVLDLTVFASSSLLRWLAEGRRGRRAGYSPLIPQLVFSGVDALFLLGVLGLATGLVVTYRLIGLLGVISGEYTLRVLVDLVALELGPLITAIILISRSGAAIAVDLANMKQHGEVEALELLGVDIHEYAVAPRILGTTVAQLGLAVYFTLVALVGGVLLAGVFISSSYFTYLHSLATVFGPAEVLGFTVKNLLFGAAIGATASYCGLQAEQSPTEVPKQMQRAIVNGLLLVFLVDGVMAAVL